MTNETILKREDGQLLLIIIVINIEVFLRMKK
jgi:hypothetical protein